MSTDDERPIYRYEGLDQHPGALRVQGAGLCRFVRIQIHVKLNHPSGGRGPDELMPEMWMEAHDVDAMIEHLREALRKTFPERTEWAASDAEGSSGSVQ